MNNDNENLPYDVQNLQSLADFINANKHNYLFNVQRLIEIPSNRKPNARDMQTTIYMDGATYSKFMKLVGNHNPEDDYVGHK